MTGKYSLEKLYRLQVDNRDGRFEVVGVIILAIIPTTLLCVLTELLPLRDPTLTWEQHGAFFAREFVRFWIIAASTNIQAGEYIPEFALSPLILVAVSTIHSILFVGTLVVIAAATGVFPVPFSTLTPLPVILVFGGLIFYGSVRHKFQQHPELRSRHARLVNHVNFSFFLTVVYMCYGFIFRHLNSHWQILMTFLLHVVKQWAKNRTWVLSHINDHDDVSGECVACGAHFFHALFSSACLQTTRSISAFVVVIGLNVMQDAVAVATLYSKSHALGDQTTTEDGDIYHRRWTRSVITMGEEVSAWSGKFREGSQVVVRSTLTRLRCDVSATAEDVECRAADPPKQQSRLQRVNQVAHLYHCREVVLLRLFIDIFAPLLILLYSTAMLYMPNNNLSYIENIHSLDVAGLRVMAVRLSLWVGCKMIVLAIVLWVLRRFEQPSGLHQLAVVMRLQWRTMQPRLVTQALYVLDFPLEHMGNDLTFRFSWIRN